MTNKNRLFSLVLLLTGGIALAKDDTPTAQQLIDAAHAASNLSTLGPYTLTGVVVLDAGGKRKQQGQVTIYRDGDRTRVDLEIEGLKDSRLTLGSRTYFDPQPDLLAVTRVAGLDRSWDPGDASDVPFWIHPKSSFGAVKPDTRAGIQVWCVDKMIGHGKERLCFDAVRGVLLSEETERTRKEFSEFTSAGAVMFPQKIRMAFPGILPIEIDQIQVAAQTPAPDVFEIPKGAMEFEKCADMVPPKILHQPAPEFSEEAKRRHMAGVVGMDVIITKEGKVGWVRVISPLGNDLDQRARDGVARWTFKPGSCEGHPVNVEVYIETDFHLY
jgi:TonB family protein